MITSVGLPCTLIFAQRSDNLSMNLCAIPVLFLCCLLSPSTLHFEWIFIPMHGFVMSCIGHLENFAGLLTFGFIFQKWYFHYTRRISHSLISPLIIRKSNIGNLSTSRWRIQGFQSLNVCLKGEIWSVKTNSHMFSLNLQLSSFIFMQRPCQMSTAEKPCMSGSCHVACRK